MSVRSNLCDGQGAAAAVSAGQDVVRLDLAAAGCEDSVSTRAERVLQLHDEARSQFEAAEAKLSSVRLDFDRARAGDFDPEPAVAIAEAAGAIEAQPVAPRRRVRAAMAVVALASVAITAGLVVSLNAATQEPAAETGAALAPSLSQAVSEVPGSAGAGSPEGEDLGSRLYAKRFANAPAAERLCLARAVYYEARGEDMDGQIAVAQVVMNRARSKKWPDTLCGVVNQGIERGEKCQFSFACFNHSAVPSGEPWERAVQVAEQAVMGQAWLREMAEATYYHTTAVAPVWRTSLTPIATLGTHVFYRDGGGLQAAALDEGKYQAAAGAAGAEIARMKAAAIAKARAKLAAGAGPVSKKAPAGGGADDWKAGIFAR